MAALRGRKESRENEEGDAAEVSVDWRESGVGGRVACRLSYWHFCWRPPLPRIPWFRVALPLTKPQSAPSQPPLAESHMRGVHWRPPGTFVVRFERVYGKGSEGRIVAAPPEEKSLFISSSQLHTSLFQYRSESDWATFRLSSGLSALPNIWLHKPTAASLSLASNFPGSSPDQPSTQP